MLKAKASRKEEKHVHSIHLSRHLTHTRISEFDPGEDFQDQLEPNKLLKAVQIIYQLRIESLI